MELKDFIKKTLLEISAAVKEANEEGEKIGLNIMVNPDNIHADSKGLERSYTVKTNNPLDMRFIEEIEFDIAVTIESEKSKDIKGGIKGAIKIASLDIGGSGSRKDKNSTLSRINFKIPVALPTSKWQR